MASVKKLIFYLFLFIITVAEGEKKKHRDKIVIHVPYKIHKHHHTHTKYKVLPVPSPKKENTIIYLKEEVQPVIKHVSPIKIKTEVIKNEPKEHYMPHQQLAAALLESLSKHKHGESDQHHSATSTEDQKHDSQMSDNSEEVAPHTVYKPIILPHHNIVPNLPLKPVLISPQHVITPKLVINPGIPQHYEAYVPKVMYQPVLVKAHPNPKMKHKPGPPKKVMHDNIAYASSQIHKVIAHPKQKPNSYSVREENQEDNMQLMRHQQKTSNSIPVPSLKPDRKGKTSARPGQQDQLKSIESVIQSNPDFDYEHVGYLVIDENSKKVVGNNYKNPVNLSR